MPRYVIQLSYHGKNYHGWQVQENTDMTVQGVLSEAIATFTREKILVQGCGRTDTGVHASKYFGHFDLEHDIKDLQQFVFKANKILPSDIAIQKIWLVKPDANTRFDAVSRTYQYHIHTFKNPFLENTSCFLFGQLNVAAMNTAAALLLKHTDFECFSKVHTEVETFLCQVSHAEWQVNDDNSLTFTITADRFLRNMVRATVGTLLQVGREDISVNDFEQIILSKDRQKAGHSAPAQGLFLVDVQYHETFFELE
jgi:tRNA pseudouridine38-40 synthase